MAWVVLALVIAGTVVAFAVGGGGDDDASDDEPAATTTPEVDETTTPETTVATTPLATAPPTTADPTTPTTEFVLPTPTTPPSTPATTATSTPPPTTQSDRPLGDSSSPLPVGDPQLSSFVYVEPFGDASWEGYIAGLVETGRGEFSSGGPGRCVVLLGTLMPTGIGDAGVSNGFSTPTVSVIAGGRVVDSTASECNTDAVELNGYGWILDTEVTTGTTYPFFAEFVIPRQRQLEAIVIGSPSGEEAIYFEPTVVEEIPPPDPGPGAPSGKELRPTGDPNASTVTYKETFGDAVWDAYVSGMVTTERGEFTTEGPGRCVVVLGTVTPREAAGAVADAFTAPPIGLIANGRLIDSTTGECDTDAIEFSGYGWILDAEVTLGTPYPFFAEFVLPEGESVGPETIVVGSATQDDAFYFEPTVLKSIAPP